MTTADHDLPSFAPLDYAAPLFRLRFCPPRRRSD